jgi:dimethylhistidine N-methyltransferase
MTRQLYHVLSQQELEAVCGTNREFALDVLLGLSMTEKSLSSRYFYDDQGSRLFQQIMELEEYYPTRCETEILRSHKTRIAELIGDQTFNLVELGSGDGRKTNLLLEEFLGRGMAFRYTPIDISEAAIKIQIDSLTTLFPTLDVKGIVAEYNNGILWHSQNRVRKNVVLFLGSNLGNFHRSQARAFLRSLWSYLNDGDLVLIGFDLKKPIDIMMNAYNDRDGITAKFNLNLLNRINRELGGEFKTEGFRHYATYDVRSGAIESYVVSLDHQKVLIHDLNQEFEFQPFEPIHTEYSYKFLETDIETLAESTGYKITDQLYDQRKYFVDSIWRVEKPYQDDV